MRYSNYLTFLLGVGLFSLSSCFTPRTIVKMESHPDEDITWNYGRQIVSTVNGDLEAQVFFDDFTKDDLIFDVEITNWGEENVLLSPEFFYLELADGSKVKALDPERQIFDGKVRRSRDEAADKNAAVAIGVAAVAAVVAVTAAEIADDDNDGLFNDGDGVDIIAPIFIDASPTTAPPPLPYFPPDVVFWEDYALRKTTLKPKFKANGKVVFPRNDLARGLAIYLPIEENVLRVRFNQSIFQP